MLLSTTCRCPCGGRPLGQLRRLSSPLCLHVSPCPSKTAAWQITCVGGPPCSCPAVRPPLINAQAGARAVWQHKTNNATTQPSLLLTEMQPTALFRPLRLHSTPCSCPSKTPTSPPSPPAPALHCSAKLSWCFFFFFAHRLLEAELNTENHTGWCTINHKPAAFVTALIVFCLVSSLRRQICFLPA